ncbi:hypothetical protein FRC11_011550 [Ceratobasidium sp. 423]|nr:hypothetical protein FRC11_011550 [Ceratobasidium sp. 423]
MPRTSKQLIVESSTIQQWEEAGTVLTTAVSRFLDLSALLETQCITRDEGSSDLVARIDSSLDHLQSTIERQLTQARLSLAKLRNRFVRSIIILPDEIISEIFLRVVYDPTDDDNPSAVMIDMTRRVELIYRRLYSLLAVCVSWKRVGLTTKALWSVVPFIGPYIGRLQSQSSGLSLQRAGNKGLHLAVSLAEHVYPKFGPLVEHLDRFSAITISQADGATFSASEILEMFLEHGAYQFVSQLSLANDQETDDHPIDQPPKALNSSLLLYKPQFLQFIESLATLRLQGVALDWGCTAFSNRLAVLQVGKISLGSQPGIDAFVSALMSACELRDLKLISISAVPNKGVYVPANGLVLPMLESLYIEDLSFNIFNIFVKVLAPGSCNLTVNLSPAFTEGHVRSGDDLPTQFIMAEDDEIHTLLGTAKIDKLIISADDNCLWSSVTGLRSLLKYMPRVKTLIMNFYNLDQDVLKALKQPPRPPLWKST